MLPMPHIPPSGRLWSSTRALSGMMSRLLAAWVVASSGLLLIAGPAAPIMLATSDASTEQPFAALGPYNYVGALGSASGTYLGHGWVLTANHVGPGPFILDGVTYAYVSGSAMRLETSPGVPADLLMFQIYPTPPNDPVSIRQADPVAGNLTILIGNGYQRGEPTSFDPNGPDVDPPLLQGWQWTGPKKVRWGINNVHDYPELLLLGTRTFRTQFDPRSLEGQATLGDSGGAVFIYDPTMGLELAGIILSVTVEWQQPYGTCLLTNQTIIANLQPYRDQILTNIAVPEPTGPIPAGPGLALISLWARRRSRSPQLNSSIFSIGIRACLASSSGTVTRGPSFTRQR